MQQKKKLGKLFASPVGSLLKAFIATIITLWLVELQQGTDLFSMDLTMVKKLLTGGVVSILPVIINWLNPSYKYEK